MLRNDDVRDELAALSQCVGKPLPADLVATAQAHGVPTRGWTDPHTAIEPSSTAESARSGRSPAQIRQLGRALRRRAADSGISLLTRDDAGWPAGTGCDALPCLWVLGDTDVAGLLDRAITITGARASTCDGDRAAQQFGRGVAERGWTIVAAVGIGIDACAVDAACTDPAQRPVLVTAGGLDAQYTTPIAAWTSRRGAVISPFPPGCAPAITRLVVRSRLLGTLSAGTVVVEAGRRGRAVLSARAAAETGRVCCAVPGPVDAVMSAGCHQLIADGTARLVTNVDTVIAAIDRRLPDLPERALYRVADTAEWDNGRWLSRQAPPLYVEATSHHEAADAVLPLLYASRPGGTILRTRVTDPSGNSTIEVSTGS